MGMVEPATGDARALTWRSGVVCALLALAAPGAMAGALAMAPIAALIGLLATPWRRMRDVIWSHAAALAPFFLWFAWVLLSTAWSPGHNARAPTHFAGGVLTGLLAIAAFGWKRERADGRVIRIAIVGFACLTAALGLFEWMTGAALNRFFHWGDEPSMLTRAPMMGAAVLAVTAWPAAAILWTWGAKGRVGAGALIAASLATCLLSEKAGQIYGALLGGLFFAASLIWGRNALRTAAYGIAAWIVAFPFLVGPLRNALGDHHLPLSWAIRLDIWADAVKRIPESPIIGRGIGAYRTLTMPMPTAEGLVQPTHPHSTSLQIWFELGAIGVLLTAAAIIMLAEKAARTPAIGKPVLAGAAGALAAGAVIANVSYGLWEEWWVATLFLAAGMVAAIKRSA